MLRKARWHTPAFLDPGAKAGGLLDFECSDISLVF